MPRKLSKDVTPVEKVTLVETRDGNEQFRIEHLQDLYVISSDTPDQFVEKFNLSARFITDVILPSDWDEMRLRNREHRFKILLDTTISNLYQSIQNELHQQVLLNEHSKILQKEAQEHFNLHGHFYVVQEKKIVEDVYGNKMEIQAIRKMHKKEHHVQSHSYVQGLLKLLEESRKTNPAAPVGEAPQSLSKGSKVDLTAYGFLPKK